MRVEIIEDITIAVSPSCNIAYKKGDIHDVDSRHADRLIELNKAKLYKEFDPVKENKMDKPVGENKSAKKRSVRKVICE